MLQILKKKINYYIIDSEINISDFVRSKPINGSLWKKQSLLEQKTAVLLSTSVLKSSISRGSLHFGHLI